RCSAWTIPALMTTRGESPTTGSTVIMPKSRFDEYCARKEASALKAPLGPLSTVALDAADADVVPIGSAWSRRLFDGDFYRSRSAGGPEHHLPAVSLVVGRSRAGHIVTGEQLARGSGPT